MVWYGYGMVMGMVRYNLVWYGWCVWTTLANGKEGGTRAETHEDVHLSFLKLGQKAEEPR